MNAAAFNVAIEQTRLAYAKQFRWHIWRE